jgi:integrase
VRVYFHDREGRLKKKAKKVGPEPTITKSEALKAEKILLGSIAKGNWFEEEKKPQRLFRDVAKAFLEKYSKPSKKSWNKDEDRINNLNPFFGNKYIDEITPFLIQKYQAERVQVVKGATVNREVALLKNIYNRAIDWGWILANPAKKLKFFKEEERCRYLTPEELKALLIALETQNQKFPYLKPVVMLALSTGMREQEVFTLKWSQVNPYNNQLLLPVTKSGKPEIIRLNETALGILKDIPKKGDYVFNNTNGKRLKSIRRSWYSLLIKAGIENFRFHDLRHSFASYLAMQGANQFDLQDALRHRSLAMTQRYVHLMPSHKDKVSGLLDTFFKHLIK